MLTGAQFGRYNREWKSLCAVRNWKVDDEAARAAFHRKYNLPGSRKDWNTRGHFDTFLAACREEKGLRTGGQKRTYEDGQRRRLVWRIKDDAKKAGLSPEYIVECARDLHVLGNWEDLDLDSLTNLMKTIHNRAGRKLGHDPRNVRHTAPRRQYTLDGGAKTYTPAKPTVTTLKEERPMQPRQRKSATVTGPTPVAPPSLSYCTHAAPPPKGGAFTHGKPATIALDEVAYIPDLDEPF